MNGESGIVESVGDTPETDCFGQSINYYKDGFGNLPRLITFRNPLGQSITEISTEKRLIEVVPGGIPNKHPVWQLEYKSERLLFLFRIFFL